MIEDVHRGIDVTRLIITSKNCFCTETVELIYFSLSLRYSGILRVKLKLMVMNVIISDFTCVYITALEYHYSELSVTLYVRCTSYHKYDLNHVSAVCTR